MQKSKIFYGWWIVLGCMLITSTMVPVVMALSNKFLIPVTQDMNISRSSFSLISTILQALGIFLSPVVAKKMASGNMRKIQSISVIGFVLAYASYSFAQNVFHLYISAFVVGIFYFSSTLIPVSIIITNWFVKKRGLAMSLAMAGVGLGGFIFSPVLTYLLESYGWRMSYRIMALIVFVIAFPAVAFLLRKKPEDMGLKAYGADEANTVSQKAPAKTGVDITVKEATGKPFFILMLIGMFICGFINAAALGQFPPAIQEMHGPMVQAAIISLYSLIGCFGKIFIGWLNDKYGITVSTVFGCVAFALVFIFMIMGQNLSMIYVMAVFFGLGMGIGNVSPPLIVAEMFGGSKYGEAYGIANSAVQIGLSTGSLAVALMYDTFGSYTSAWILLFILTCITLFTWVGSLNASKKYIKN
ncbi:MAG TPA: MFS transporter [Clostridiales bacterium]|nr:MFS transporter [Lachnospiraceae bacterium]HAQ40398.1 MFS transporter [Clostridiales bacterium]